MNSATRQRSCTIDGCDADVGKGGLCWAHRYRIRLHGDPHFTQWTVADPYDVQIAANEGRVPPGLTRLERVLLGRALTDRGHSAANIAELLGVTPRTVHRWRQAHGGADPNGQAPGYHDRAAALLTSRS